MSKCYAAHYLLLPAGEGHLRLHGVEVEEGYVIRIFPLTEEKAGTEWLPGVILLEQWGKHRMAWHCYPFDFESMRAVSGTRRRRLL